MAGLARPYGDLAGGGRIRPPPRPASDSSPTASWRCSGSWPSVNRASRSQACSESAQRRWTTIVRASCRNSASDPLQNWYA